MMCQQLKAGASCAVRPSRKVVQAVASLQRPQADAKAAAVAIATGALVLGAAPAARAEATVDTTVDSVVSAVKATGEFVNAGLTTVQAGLDVAKQAVDVVAPYAKQAFDAVSPVVVEGAKKTAEFAAPVVNAAAPAVKGTVSDLVKSSGLDLKTLSKTVDQAGSVAGTATSKATPVVAKVVDFLTTTDPVTLGEYALGAVALYYIVPAVLGSLKGYQGSISAASALDSLVTEAGTLLIDLRSSKEKEASGVTDVPGAASGKVIEVEYAALEDKKLRGQLKDAGFIEAQTTALQVASLKRISKGSKIVLLDRYGPVAEGIARELAKKGFGKVYVVSGGFDGRGGWVQSKLQIKPYTSAAASFVAAPAFNRTGTLPTRKSLPAPKA